MHNKFDSLSAFWQNVPMFAYLYFVNVFLCLCICILVMFFYDVCLYGMVLLSTAELSYETAGRHYIKLLYCIVLYCIGDNSAGNKSLI